MPTSFLPHQANHAQPVCARDRWVSDRLQSVRPLTVGYLTHLAHLVRGYRMEDGSDIYDFMVSPTQTLHNYCRSIRRSTLLACRSRRHFHFGKELGST